MTPGSQRSLTEVKDDRKMQNEISNQGSFQPVAIEESGLEIECGLESNKGGSEGATNVSCEKEEGSDVSAKDQNKKENMVSFAKSSKSEGSSWVDVTQERKVLRKYDVEITEKEGQKSVEIPDEVIEKVNHLWEDYLIGKFLDTAPHIAKIHATVNRIWNQKEKKELIDVHVVDGTTMKFKVTNPMMRARILKRGMWSIGNIPMVITKWVPEEMKEKPEITAIPLWVHLKNVPMHMYSWQGLSFITSAAGSPVRLHPETAACTNFKVAKIFVNVDLTKELPSKINFTKNGVSSLVEFIYPWLPLRCSTCGKWGHTDKVCIINKKDGAGKSVEQIIKEGEMGKDGHETKEAEVSKEGIEREANGNESTQNENKKKIEEGEVVEEWEEVTPGKGSRSPNLEYGQVRILTPSRYSALIEVNEEGDGINLVEYEEVVSVEEEIIKEGNTEDINNEIVGTEVNDEDAVVVHEKKDQEEDNIAVIAGIEHWPDLTANSIRPSLPRKSKTLHKIVPDKSRQGGTPGKKRNKNSSL